jgi:photosystem II stability/assembly factor-like uncharacterized protein
VDTTIARRPRLSRLPIFPPVALSRKRSAMSSITILLALLAAISAARAQSTFWAPSTGPYGGNVSSIVVTRTGALFAATSHGVFRSTNDGARWSLSAPVLREELVMGLAATSSGAVIASSSTRYLRSTDDGLSWTDLSGDDKPYYVTNGLGERLFGIAADFDPFLALSTDDGVSWVTTRSVTYDVDAIEPYLVLAHTSRRASRDSGRTWSPLSGPVQFIGAGAILGDTLFLAGADAASQRLIARSVDSGATWTDAHAGLEGQTVRSMLIDARGDLIAILPEGVARWNGTHQRWSIISSQSFRFYDFYLPHLEVALAVDEQSLHAPTPWGNLRSTDHGETWARASDGMNAHSARAMEGLSTGGILVGTESEVVRSNDLGMTWTPVDTMGWSNAIARSSTGAVFAGGFHGMRRSTDHGTTWSDVRQRDTVYVYDIVGTSAGLVAAAILVKGQHNYFISTSTDDGETWQDAPLAAQNQLETLSAGPTGELFLATEDKVRRSSDRGVTWRHAVEVDEYVTAVLPLANGNLVVGTGEGRVIVLDSAAGMLDRSVPLDTMEITGLEIDRDGRIYAITAAGKAFRRSGLAGRAWEDISSGIEMRSLLHLFAHPSGYLFLATAGGSVQRSSAQVSDVEPAPLTIPELDLSMIAR